MTKIPTDQELQEILDKLEESKTGPWDQDYGFSGDIAILVPAVRQLVSDRENYWRPLVDRLQGQVAEAQQEIERLKK